MFQQLNALKAPNSKEAPNFKIETNVRAFLLFGI